MDLNKKIEEILLTGEKQLQYSVKDFLNHAVNKTENIYLQNDFFKKFDTILFNKIKINIFDENFKGDMHCFNILYSKSISEANQYYVETQSLREFDSSTLQFMYYHVYFNAYIKYSFSILFNGHNNQMLEELRCFNEKDVINCFKYYLDLFSILKIRMSFNDDILGEFDTQKEIELENLMVKIFYSRNP